jgi:hypothetical protein
MLKGMLSTLWPMEKRVWHEMKKLSGLAAKTM